MHAAHAARLLAAVAAHAALSALVGRLVPRALYLLVAFWLLALAFLRMFVAVLAHHACL